jgi:hypothetical protein
MGDWSRWRQRLTMKEAAIQPHVAQTRMGANSRRASERRERTMLVTREKPGALERA